MEIFPCVAGIVIILLAGADLAAGSNMDKTYHIATGKRYKRAAYIEILACAACTAATCWLAVSGNAGAIRVSSAVATGVLFLVPGAGLLARKAAAFLAYRISSRLYVCARTVLFLFADAFILPDSGKRT